MKYLLLNNIKIYNKNLNELNYLAPEILKYKNIKISEN